MKTKSSLSLLSFTFAIGSLLTQLAVAEPTVGFRSVQDHPQVARLLRHLSDVAGERDAIAHFTYTESFATNSVGRCQILPARKALSEVLNIMNLVLFDGQNEDGMMEDTYAEEIEALDKFIGSSAYQVCRATESFGRTAEKRLTLISVKGDVRLQLTTGYND